MATGCLEELSRVFTAIKLTLSWICTGFCNSFQSPGGVDFHFHRLNHGIANTDPQGLGVDAGTAEDYSEGASRNQSEQEAPFCSL